MSDRNGEQEPIDSERDAGDETDGLQGDVASEWEARENPYRGATAFDKNAIFTTIVALFLAALVVVTGLMVARVMVQQETQPEVAAAASS